MTIPASQDLISGPYDGNDVTTVFDFNFTIYAETELIVTLLDADGATETVQQLATHYTVQPSGGSFPAAGTITMLTPPETGAKLTAEPNITRSQEKSFSNQGSISLVELENAYDKLTSLSRQLIGYVGRVLSVSPFETGTIVLPLSVPDKFLGWNAAGDALENKTPNASDFLTLPAAMADNELMRNNGTNPGTFQRAGVKIDDTASVYLPQQNTGDTITLELGTGRTTNGVSQIDLIGDTTYDDFGLRIKRSGGANAVSEVIQRGTGNLKFTGSDGAMVQFSGNLAILLPDGTTAQRPTPVTGMIRHNNSLNRIEIYSDSAWRPLPLQSDGKMLGSRTVLTSGSGATYTPPAGCRMIEVTCQGAGGGGGGIDGVASGVGFGGCGAGGGHVRKLIPIVGASYTYSVGSAGAAGAAAGGAGGAGGDTTFTDGASLSLVANGGGGGTGAVAAAARNTSGVSGGAASGGDVNIPGQSSAPGWYASSPFNMSVPFAGGSPLGSPGAQALASLAGIAATGYGAGGSGGVNSSSTATDYAGGAGAPGVILIDEYY